MGCLCEYFGGNEPYHNQSPLLNQWSNFGVGVTNRKQFPPLHYFPALQWRHNEHDSVSNHQPHDWLLNRLSGRRSKKMSKLHITGLCGGNSQVPSEFPTQMASNVENVSNWWRHHGFLPLSKHWLPSKYHVMFIFHRYCHSSAVVKPTKYENDSNNITGIFNEKIVW